MFCLPTSKKAEIREGRRDSYSEEDKKEEMHLNETQTLRMFNKDKKKKKIAVFRKIFSLEFL